tara:strand:- start:736 stop:903 length:168 start_codon:yes stop_codon:yes gene_type:complete
MMTQQSLSVSGLHYEELVLLQELMIMIDNTDLIDHPILVDDRKTFNSLFQKVMKS